MQRTVSGRQHGFVHGFAERRVGKDDLAEFRVGGLQRLGDTKTLDLFGHVRADTGLPQKVLYLAPEGRAIAREP